MHVTLGFLSSFLRGRTESLRIGEVRGGPMQRPHQSRKLLFDRFGNEAFFSMQYTSSTYVAVTVIPLNVFYIYMIIWCQALRSERVEVI